MGLAKKKGLSPTVSTLLMIALMLVLAAIIFLWTRGFLKESVMKNGLDGQDVCKQIRFDAYFKIGSLDSDGVTGELSIVNEGNIPIKGFEIKQRLGGDSFRTPFYFSISPGSTLSGYPIGLMGTIEDVEFFPIILGISEKDNEKSKKYTCLDNSKKIRIP